MTARREDRRRQHDSKSILKVFLISEELQVTNDIRFNGQRAFNWNISSDAFHFFVQYKT